jgi:hypothetical protein
VPNNMCRHDFTTKVCHTRVPLQIFGNVYNTNIPKKA